MAVFGTCCLYLLSLVSIKWKNLKNEGGGGGVGKHLDGLCPGMTLRMGEWGGLIMGVFWVWFDPGGSIKWFVYPSCGAGELEPGQLRVEVLFIIFPPVGSHERPLETVAARRPRSKGPAGGVRQTHSKPLSFPGGLWSTKHVPHLHRPAQWKLPGPMEMQGETSY